MGKLSFQEENYETVKKSGGHFRSNENGLSFGITDADTLSLFYYES